MNTSKHVSNRLLWQFYELKTFFGIIILTLFMTSPLAHAFNIGTDNPDLKMSWDNNVKYSTAYRLADPSSKLLSDINQDDGDRAFNKGFISNRFDLLSEFDLKYKNHGIRLSGAAWYDSAYLNKNDNNSPQTYNGLGNNDEFTDSTKNLHGMNAEFLDAFFFGTEKIDNTSLSYRMGQLGMLWGESLFFGNNGIAAGMAPIDAVKGLSVPNTQFKELIRPIPQITSQLQITPDFSIGAYYQFKWDKTRIPAVDSYFANLDFLGEGGERLIVGNPVFPGGGPLAFFRGNDMEADDSGQFGANTRFRFGDYDFGLYAIRYNDKVPQIYLRPDASPNPVTGRVGEYSLVYPEGIQAYGASITKTLGVYNLAGEVSYRHNTPLVSDPQTVMPGIEADNNGNPLYAVGNSLHAQISTLAVFGPSFIAQESSLLAEIAWNSLLDITKNSDALDPNTRRNAWGLRLIYEPMYRQIFSGLDLSFPIGVSYFPEGASSVVANFGPDKGGDISLGISASYLDAWRFRLNYTHYYGEEDTFLNESNQLSFKQSYADRDFVSFTVSRAF